MKYDESGMLKPMSDREVVSSSKRWIVAFVVAIIVLPMIIWGASVLLSGPKGKGDQIVRNNSEINRTEQQQMFEDLYAQIRSLDDRVDVAQEVVENDEAAGRDSRISTTNLTGLQNVCLEAVGSYNAAARQVLSRDWRAEDLPQEIQGNNPDTDCKPEQTK